MTPSIRYVIYSKHYNGNIGFVSVIPGAFCFCFYPLMTDFPAYNSTRLKTLFNECLEMLARWNWIFDYDNSWLKMLSKKEKNPSILQTHKDELRCSDIKKFKIFLLQPPTVYLSYIHLKLCSKTPDGRFFLTHNCNTLASNLHSESLPWPVHITFFSCTGL